VIELEAGITVYPPQEDGCRWRAVWTEGGRQWSRKHAHTQRRLCERFVAPVIGSLPCQDIRVADTQRIVNAAPTAGEGGRLHALVSALVGGHHGRLPG
jgi:hypothetical protein